MQSKAIAAILALAIALAWLLSRRAPDSAVVASPQSEQTEIRGVATPALVLPSSASSQIAVAQPKTQTIEPASAALPAPTLLTEANFEALVAHCFQGEACQLDDDPKKMYADFKLAGRHAAADQLLSFMRKQLQDAAFAAKYKDTLKRMIDDYYPAQERQFQDAAFYDYAGEPEKSLALYQDLEKKSQSDATLRPAPKLNIANVLFTLKRLPEAKTYYEAAREDFETGREASLMPGKTEMLRFIDQRIGDCSTP